MPCLVVCWYRNMLSLCLFVGVFVQHTPLTTTFLRQSKDSCMNLLNCCIMNCGELHVQSCHSYCSHGSEDVARLRAFAVFLYAFRKTLTQCLFSWSVVSACACRFWSLNNNNTFVRYILLWRSESNICCTSCACECPRFLTTWVYIVSHRRNRNVAVSRSQAVAFRF